MRTPGSDDRSATAGPATDRGRGPKGERDGGGDPGAVMALRSPAFSDHTTIPVRYADADGSPAPPLEWSGVPDGTVELALVCEDLDADGPAAHWLLTGIDPSVDGIGGVSEHEPAGARPSGDDGRADAGPWPPSGDEPHRYAFRLYALDAPLDVGADADADAVREVLDDRRTATGTLVGLFAR